MRAARWALASGTVILPAQCMPQIQTEGVTRKTVRAGSKTGSKRMICLSFVAGLREPGLAAHSSPQATRRPDSTIAAYT